MKLSELKARREAIMERELEIAAQLAESKRAYIVDKVEAPMTTRVTLEAEHARLALEKFQITSKLNASKAATRVYRNAMAHAVLIKLVNDRGLSELVIEADRVAQDLATEPEGVEA